MIIINMGEFMSYFGGVVLMIIFIILIMMLGFFFRIGSAGDALEPLLGTYHSSDQGDYNYAGYDAVAGLSKGFFRAACLVSFPGCVFIF